MSNLNNISGSSYKLSHAIGIETSVLSVEMVDKMHGLKINMRLNIKTVIN